MLAEYLLEKAKKKNLDPITRAKALKRLIDEFSFSSRKIAEKIKKSPAYVSNTLRLLSLPEALQDALVSGLIAEGHARALAAIKDPKEMIMAYKHVLQKDGSVRMAERLARKIKTKLSKKSVPTPPELIKKIKREIAEIFDDARVELLRSRAQTKVTITFKGNYERTEPLLQKLHRLLTKPILSKGQ